MSVFNDDVLLIHIPKCAGTSARDYLLAHLPNAVDSLAEPKGPLPVDSTPLRHISEYTGRPLDSWKRIIIPIRNPYEQVVSHWSYHWNRYAQGGRHVHDETAAAFPRLHAWLLHPHSDWRTWYETAVRCQPIGKAAEVIRSTGFYEYYSTTESGEVPDNVTFIDCAVITAEFPKAVAEWCGGEHEFPHTRSSPHSKDPHAYFVAPIAYNVVHERFRWAFANFYERVAA